MTAVMWTGGLLSLSILLLAASLASASEGHASSPDEQTCPLALEPSIHHDPATRGPFGIEFGMGVLDEAWNLNGSREWLLNGTVSLSWAFKDRASLVIQLQALRVFQQTVRHAFARGMTPIVRYEVLETTHGTLFTEIGFGGIWSDTTVPARGTRFNYAGLAGFGLSRRLGRRTHGVAGFRWLHLSNNGREGHDHNPDIQALGGYAAMMVGF